MSTTPQRRAMLAYCYAAPFEAPLVLASVNLAADAGIAPQANADGFAAATFSAIAGDMFRGGVEVEEAFTLAANAAIAQVGIETIEVQTALGVAAGIAQARTVDAAGALELAASLGYEVQTLATVEVDALLEAVATFSPAEGAVVEGVLSLGAIAGDAYLGSTGIAIVDVPDGRRIVVAASRRTIYVEGG